MVKHVEYTNGEKAVRAADMTEFLDTINFTQPRMSPPLSLDAFKVVLIDGYVECKKSRHPDAFAPSRSRLERIYNDKMALSKDPKAILHKPEGFCGTEATWKHDMKNKYLLKDTQVYVSAKEKDEIKWQELVPLEEYFSVFARSHLDNSEKHCGRDKTYKFSAAGERQCLSKKLITALVNRCGCFKKREREDDEDVDERPAKRGAGTPAGVAAPLPPAPVSDIYNSSLALSASLPNIPARSAAANHFDESFEDPFATNASAYSVFVDTPPFNDPSAADPPFAGPSAVDPSASEDPGGYNLTGNFNAYNSDSNRYFDPENHDCSSPAKPAPVVSPQAPLDTIDPRLLQIMPD
ncbi:hypothetical protein EYC80_000178 [Monilinia laxa]|uniref:Uncharacterized protein n=1 Tax=Monilinia laxa TaxID=61186 RepID=A0A5N6K9R9_MONLA|nr:hypothetical protein EYC80_000178 [Monilinia laxa]